MLDFPGVVVSHRGSYFETVKQAVLSSNAAPNRDRLITRYLHAARQFIDEPIRVGVLGEVNSGKTEISNLILGVQLLPSSVLNNTMCPTLLRFGEHPAVRQYHDRSAYDEQQASDLHRLVQQNGFLVECRLPLPLLRSIEIVDFPSFENFDFFCAKVPSLLERSHVLVWCSSMVRAWTATEQDAWGRLPDKLKHCVLFVVTHADKLPAEERNAVIARISTEAGPFDVEPICMATTSAMQARNPRGQIVSRGLWDASGGAQFFRSLGQLLQKSLSKRQQRLESSVGKFAEEISKVLVKGKTPKSPQDEWRRLEIYFKNNEDESIDYDSVFQVTSRFRSNILLPWLKFMNRPPNEIEYFMRMIPDKKEILLPIGGHHSRSRLSAIFNQIDAELGEYIECINCDQ